MVMMVEMSRMNIKEIKMSKAEINEKCDNMYYYLDKYKFGLCGASKMSDLTQEFQLFGKKFIQSKQTYFSLGGAQGYKPQYIPLNPLDPAHLKQTDPHSQYQ